MKPLARTLRDYPPAMLRAIAEVNDLSLSSNVARQMVEQLSGFLGDPAQLAGVLAACTPAAMQALAALMRDDGRSLRLIFERQHGAIRAIGPGRLEREKPHLAPDNPTEELWYRGLIYSAFAETPTGVVEFLYIPSEIAAWLPAPEPASQGLPMPASQTPNAVQSANDFLLHDLCTLLCLTQTGEVRLVDGDDSTSWQRTSLYELQRFLLQPHAGHEEDLRNGPGHPAALTLALANDLDWLQPRNPRRLALHAGAVRSWLEAPREQQRQVVIEAWQASQTWNDLCRTPSLVCEETGSWHNDPVATRARLLPFFAQLDAGAWYELDTLVATAKTAVPDFQRPDGVYDTWYIRERDHQTYLRGFDYWDAVEGALLRFLITGPLHWLGVVDLGFDALQPSHARPTEAPHAARIFSITQAGHAWLSTRSSPAEPTPGSLTVLPDYTILVPADAPLLDRFRVSRFTTWETPAPLQPDAVSTFRYRITRSGLRRAADQGIDALRVLAFLQERCVEPLPAAVVAGLQRWQDHSTSAVT